MARDDWPEYPKRSIDIFDPIEFLITLPVLLGIGIGLPLLGHAIGIRIPFAISIFAAFVAVVLLLHWRMTRDVRRELRTHDGQICTSYGYDMRGQSDGAKCPECGAVWVVVESRRKWDRWMRWQWPHK